MTVANILTLARLFLSPVFVVLFLIGYYLEALVVFSIAGFTDLIDGTVARLLKQHSRGGALLDPFADKLLVESCFLLLTTNSILPVWFFALALLRDLTIIVGMIYLERTKVEMPYSPVLASKLATLCQLAVAVFGLVLVWRPGAALSGYLSYSVLVAAALIVVSFVQYIFIGVNLLKARKNTVAKSI